MSTPQQPTPNSAAPGDYATAITPSDSTNLPIPARGVYVGTGGDVTVVMAALGNVVTFKNAPDGAVLPVRISRVNATATTASNLVAIY